jgi:hypothetical protein
MELSETSACRRSLRVCFTPKPRRFGVLAKLSEKGQ